MSEGTEKDADARDERRKTLGDDLAAQLDSDARFGSGLSRELSDEERWRVQTAGAARPGRITMPRHALPDGNTGVPGESVPGTEHWTEAVARLLQTEQQAKKTPPPGVPPRTTPPPGLEEAEQFLRELESQPRDLDNDAEPESEVSF